MPPGKLGPPPRFFTFDYSQWPGSLNSRPPNLPADQPSPQEDRKPFDPLMPFHRIRVPANQIIPPRGVRIPKTITGDGYGAGARSTHDYDGKFGEDLGKDLAEVVEKLLPPLALANLVAKGVSKVLGFLVRQIPGAGKVADFLDNLDPLKDLLGAIGNAIDSVMVEAMVRSVPGWVPTFDEKLAPNNQLLEVDGILVRSHQRYDGIPFWQWRRWYDWRFAVAPSPMFMEVVGFGNTRRDDDNSLGDLGEKLKNYHKEHLPRGPSAAEAIAECEWDLGVIGLREGPNRVDRSGNPFPNDRVPIFFDELKPRKDHDWCWPQTGMFFWAIGRSVYDCSRATGNKGSRTPKNQRKLNPGSDLSEDERRDRGVHINQLHPLKAIATARWEAFKFKENPKHVPAIQFMFYTNTHLSSAGFFDKVNPSRSGFLLDGQDYQFIIDLPPPAVTRKAEYPIGHTPEFPSNTLVLKPRLVVDANFEPFKKDGSGGTSSGVMEDGDDRLANDLTVGALPTPIVELFGLEPDKPPRQARITVPLKGPLKDNAYGVLLSIGWADPEASQAKQVKKVTVRLTSVKPAQAHEDLSDAEWNLNVGVNGRWFHFRFEVPNLNPIQLDSVAGGPVELVMHLAANDFVMISAHGTEEDGADDMIRLFPEFPAGTDRPPKEAPALPPATELLDSPGKIIEFKKRALDRAKTMFKDRLLRDAADATLPSGPPNQLGQVPTTTISVPMVGRELEWNDSKDKDGKTILADIDTDDNHRASLTARAMFLRFAVGNLFDANDFLGSIDPKMGDPARKSPDTDANPRRLQDATDAPNPLIVQDILDEVGPGAFKKCQLSAYETTFVGRMHTTAYDPNKLDYTLFYEVKVEELPA